MQQKYEVKNGKMAVASRSLNVPALWGWISTLAWGLLLVFALLVWLVPLDFEEPLWKAFILNIGMPLSILGVGISYSIVIASGPLLKTGSPVKSMDVSKSSAAR